MSRPRTPVPATLSELYQRAVLAPRTGCLVWDGRMVWNGYGQIAIGRQHAAELGCPQTILVHRLAWELANGPIPKGMQIDHRCSNRACVNVAHMELVTPGENTRRGYGPALSSLRMRLMRTAQRDAYKTHCKHGHALTDDNVYTDKRGFRSCKACQRQRTQAYRARPRHDGPTPV